MNIVPPKQPQSVQMAGEPTTTFRSDLFKGHTALITGAARGIGRGIAESFAKLGADVVLQDIQVEELERTVRHLQSYGVRTHAVPGDLSETRGCQRSLRAGAHRDGSHRFSGE